jgi:uncharacterized membrane protein
MAATQKASAASTSRSPASAASANPVTGRLKNEVGNLAGALRDRAIESVKQKAGDAAGRLTDYAEQGGGPGLMAAATGTKKLAEGKSPARAMSGAGLAGLKGKIGQMFGKGKGGKGKGQKIKVTNIVETIDVGVPVDVAYNQWTQFREFPSFMKKVENAEQESDEKLHWRAQIFWSHRNWKSTILRQTPDSEIVWRSEGDKGYVDGAVTFHALAPNLTRIVVVLEYFPKGLFEHTGNLWRAQGRRARLELKHFRRHVMTQTILHPDEVEGWRGVIEDGKVTVDHETALREEQERGEDAPQDELPEGEEPQDELAEDELPEDELPEDELSEDELPEDELPEDEPPEDELPEDELLDDEEPEDEERGEELPAGDYEEEDAEEDRGKAPRPARRSRATAQRRPPRRRPSPSRS